MSSGVVFNITEFAVHDGPGIRTTVFLKGCPLRCAWCHNPEGQSLEPEEVESTAGKRMSGKIWNSTDLAAKLNQQADLLRPGGGGITFSGGEPLMQPEFVMDVISRLSNMHTLLQTSGYAKHDVFDNVVRCVDMIYYDLKLIDTEKHFKYTGVNNAIILENIRYLDTMNKPYVVRVPLIPGITDTADNLSEIADTVSGLKNMIRVDLLPYNKAAGGKYKACGKVFQPDWDESTPCNADVSIFTRSGINALVS